MVNDPTHTSDFIEAALEADQAHGSGSTVWAEELLAENPAIASSSLYAAVMVGEMEAVRGFLDGDADAANRKGGPRDWEPILYLCFSRFLRTDAERAARMVECARLLLAAGADPNVFWTDPGEAEGNRETPIYGAAGVAANRDLTALLLEAGAEPNDGETPYHSVEHPGVPCLALLWPHFNDFSRNIAIQHQVDFDDLDGLRTLLQLGADPNAQGFTPRTPLHACVFRGHGPGHFELLFEHGANPDLEDAAGRTPYAWAARAGRGDLMELLAGHGASTRLSPQDAFLAACAAGAEDTVTAVLGADPDIVAEMSDEDRAQICEVAAHGNTDGVRTMLDAGFNIDTRGLIWSEGPIHRAAMDGHFDTVKLLYERGADITLRDASYHASPLGWAMHGGHTDIVEYLHQDPSRLDLRDAMEWGKVERVAELLEGTEADAPIAGGEPGVLLRAAAHSGKRELVEMLLQKGADPTRRNSEGMTALDYAVREGHDAVAEVLRNVGA